MTASGHRLFTAWLVALALPLAAWAQEWSPPPIPSADLDQRATRPPKPPEDFLSVNGALVGVLQWPAASDVARGTTFASGVIDLTLTARPADSTRIFLNVVGSAGPGPDERLGTLSGANKNSEHLGNEQENVRLLKAILRWSWQERLVISVGKIDVEDYFDRNVFAEDEQIQFLNASLNTNPVLASPANGPGVAVRFNAGDWRSAFAVQGQDDVFGDLRGLPFVIGEVGRRNVFALRGHYRLWARVRALEFQRDRTGWATGVSFDQLVTPAVGLFFRAGVSRSGGERATSYAWATGVQATPTWLGRPGDSIGIGYSELRQADGHERVLETYYRFALTDFLALTADVQWIPTGVNTVTGTTTRHLVVPGFRAVFAF